MTSRPRDTLLNAVRFLLGLAMAVVAFAAGALLIAIPVVLFMRDKVMIHIAAPSTPHGAIWAIIALLAFGAAAAVMGFYFFRHLFRIVGSVGAGDAFAPINAQRLSAMGWITVVVHIIGIPMGALAHWVQSVTENFHAEIAISPSGILLALILFILARVFRQGAAMREELEGTV